MSAAKEGGGAAAAAAPIDPFKIQWLETSENNVVYCESCVLAAVGGQTIFSIVCLTYSLFVLPQPRTC